MSQPEVIWLEDDLEQGHSREVYEGLRTCGVIVHPTDTVYGLLALADSPKAYQQIYQLKGRSFSKPLALLVHGQMEIARVVRGVLRQDDELMDQFNNGELTVILNPIQIQALPGEITSIQPGPVGIRAPRPNSHAARKLIDLIETYGGCIWATSVNRSGQPAATTADEVLAWLDELASLGIEPPELVVLSRTPGSGQPSRVVDLTGPEPRFLR